MGTPRVRMYATATCPYCIRAKRLLEAEGIAYEEVDLTGDHQARAELRRDTGWRTVPAIFLDGELLGGYDELAALDRRGGLEPFKRG